MSCIGSTCLLTHIHFHDAYGMGLSYSSSEDKYFVSNASRPAWTESQYELFFVLAPLPTHLCFLQVDVHTHAAIFDCVLQQ